MSDQKRDYYEILGVDRSSSTEEIKKAFRKKAIKFHPDKNPGNKQAESSFKEASEAYKVLSDPQKKQAYDQFGHAGVSGQGGFSGDGAGFGDINDIFGDIFGDFFGGGSARGRGGRSRAQRGSDLEYNLEISFEEAAFGGEKNIEFNKEDACTTCSGSGAKKGTSSSTCTTCSGSGQVNYQQGFFTLSRSCSACYGKGSIIKEKCSSCSGRGTNRKKSKISVKIPPGIDNGQRLKLNGKGEAGRNGGPSGDLFVLIMIKKHEFFTRENFDVYCEMPISISQASLGTEVQVPTLEGKVNMKIPSGTQNGHRFRLPHKGVAHLNSGRRGHQFVTINVEIPSKLTSRQRELLEEFASLSKESYPKNSSFIDKMKEWF